LMLFDASSIVNLVKRGVVKPLAGNATLDLAVYEAFNAVWKEHAVLGRIDGETAGRLARILAGVFELMDLLSAAGSAEAILGLAVDTGLTFYDAAYLYKAGERGYTLVTDDKRLLREAAGRVEALSTAQLLGENM